MHQGINKSSLIPTLFLFIIFLTSNDTVLFGTNINRLFNYVPRIVAFISIFLLPLVSRRKIKGNLQLIILFLLTIIVILSGMVNDANFDTVISRLLSIMLGFSIATNFNLRDYAQIYNKFIYFISIIAIIFHFFSYLLPQVIYMLPAITNTAGHVVYVIGFGGVFQTQIGRTLVRSSAIFWEPGAYSIYLVLALLFEFFILNKSKDHNKKVAVFLICLILTFSTTGIIAFSILLLVVISPYHNRNLSRKTRVALQIFILLLLPIMIGGESNPIFSILFTKMIDRTSTTVTRYASIVNGIEIALDHPVLGISSNKIREYMMIYGAKSRFNFGANPMLTNTVTYQFAAYGVIFGIVFVLGNIRFMKLIANKKIVGYGLIIVLFAAYVGEAFYSFFPFVLVFYGFETVSDKQQANTYMTHRTIYVHQ